MSRSVSDSGVSVIVPTYQEAGNLPSLIERLAAVSRSADLDLELVICDDNSRDGTEELVARAGLPWVRLIVRTTNRGLSPAVMEGLLAAKNPLLVVMDADLSHPPEKIPELLAELRGGSDFVIGSRYVAGASTDEHWGFFRWINSKVATLLARPFTSIRDPMSGFFALERKTMEKGTEFNPIGYKIGLELLVKCRCRKVGEVPIHFADRQIGKSKLNFKEQLRYLQHLRRLTIFKYPNWAYVLQFLFVGGAGTLVNLVALSALSHAGVGDAFALAGGIVVSFLFNFVLNRRFTFSYARGGSIVSHFLGFAAASGVGGAVNMGVSLLFRHLFPSASIQVAALAGIASGTGFNYATNRYLVFRKRQPAAAPAKTP
jgi:dolichol-phosphate mannosyltransferase